jgi:hypothetical protein
MTGPGFHINPDSGIGDACKPFEAVIETFGVH